MVFEMGNNYTKCSNGLKLYNINYNGNDLYVYEGFGNFIISLEELEFNINNSKDRYDFDSNRFGSYRRYILPNINKISNDKSKYITTRSNSNSINAFFNSLNNKHM